MGVPVPDDPEHVMYVWLDALTNYITALNWQGQGAEFGDILAADLHGWQGYTALSCGLLASFLMAAYSPLPAGCPWQWTAEDFKIFGQYH